MQGQVRLLQDENDILTEQITRMQSKLQKASSELHTAVQPPPSPPAQSLAAATQPHDEEIRIVPPPTTRPWSCSTQPRVLSNMNPLTPVYFPQATENVGLSTSLARRTEHALQLQRQLNEYQAGINPAPGDG